MRAIDTNEPGAWVSVLALAQAIWVLGSVFDRSALEQARAVEMLLSHERLVMQDHETVAEALQLFRNKPAIGFSDCLMLQLAKKAGHLPLGTFDKALARMTGSQRL